MKKLTIAAVLAAVGIAVAVPFTFAQTGGHGPGMMGPYGQSEGSYGPGMMYGYGMGPGMMGSYGGHGMGPGMMGGYGGYGMGPGMMGGYGGYGMGPGMMGGYGGYAMGPGMMGGYGSSFGGALDLSDDQREKITKIQEGLSTKHWDLMGKMQEQQYKLRDLIASGKADDATIGKAYKHMEELRQQMWTTATDARTQMDALLTKPQREQLQRGWGRDTK